MKKNKGISLIVLVITIIVMIILAGTIILSLNNSGIIGKAQDAVIAANLNEVKNLANVAWAEAYMNGKRTEQELSVAVKDALTKNNITEDKYKGYTIIVTATGVDFGTKALNPSGVIPEGGVYYVGVTSTYVGTYTGATATYTAGDNFPTTVSTGDVYVYGDYEYRYNQCSAGYYLDDWIWKTNDVQTGWGVQVVDRNKTTYELILETINNKYITNMNNTFALCDYLTELPEGFTIPKGVRNMEHTFQECTSLKFPDSFAIPEGITSLEGTFMECYELTSLPENFKIPSSVTDMSDTFNYTGLTEIPKDLIPNGVTSLKGTFANCESLTELPEGFTIPNSVTDMSEMFYQCFELSKLPNSFRIPNGVTSMYGMFSQTALEKLPDGFTIPNSVKDMSFAFDGCNLTTLPDGFTIPNSVTHMEATFGWCDSLTGTITINANPKVYMSCFEGTEQPIVLTGSSTMLDKLAATSENGNVTVK